MSDTDVTLEHAQEGPRGAGWYLIYRDLATEGPFLSERHARGYAKKMGHSVTLGTAKHPDLRLARSAQKQGPFQQRYLIHSLFGWLAYWCLTGMDRALRKVSSLVWQARWRLGFVLFDDPCPRCGASLWTEAKAGCTCALTISQHASVVLPEGAEVIDYDGGRQQLIYHSHSRRELFHWARVHRFFAEHATDALRRDDRQASQKKTSS